MPADPPSTAASASAPPDPRIGTVVGSLYRIVAPLGEGGIGAIYLAEYISSGGRVAIKFLREEYTREPEAVARFEREVGVLAGLAHDNIVRALDCGRTPEGESYMVMELAEGETLREVINRAGVLPLPTCLAIARLIGSALARAHALGIVHRDLKPENVMVADVQSAWPRLKVLDFGMARIASGLMSLGGQLTKKGSVFGSPSYMAPEQAMGQPADARADQYALGVMLYEMLSGRRPFGGPTPIDILKAQIQAPVPPLLPAAYWVPAPVAAVVEQMLAKRPEQRFSDVAAAIAALDAAVAAPQPGGSTVPGPTPSRLMPPEVARVPSLASAAGGGGLSRGHLIAALVAAALALTLVLGVVALLGRDSSPAPPAPPAGAAP